VVGAEDPSRAFQGVLAQDASLLGLSAPGQHETVLDPSQPNTPTAGMALQGANLIYASVNDIRFVPTAGTTIPPSSRTIVTAASRVTALHAVSNGVHWASRAVQSS
jgi:hypothetical protein